MVCRVFFSSCLCSLFATAVHCSAHITVDASPVHRVVIPHSISPSHVDKPRRHLISFAWLINSLPIRRERLQPLSDWGTAALRIRVGRLLSFPLLRTATEKPGGHGPIKPPEPSHLQENRSAAVRCSSRAPLLDGWLHRDSLDTINRSGDKKATAPNRNVSDLLETAFPFCRTRPG